MDETVTVTRCRCGCPIEASKDEAGQTVWTHRNTRQYRRRRMPDRHTTEPELAPALITRTVSTETEGVYLRSE